MLAIDPDGTVRVYKRGPYGGIRVIDQVEIVTPQQDDLAEQLELLRRGTPLQFVEPRVA